MEEEIKKILGYYFKIRTLGIFGQENLILANYADTNEKSQDLKFRLNLLILENNNKNID